MKRVFLIFSAICIVSVVIVILSNPSQLPINQAGYQIGYTKSNIENPVIIDLSRVEGNWYKGYSMYICSDSVAKFCMDSVWVNRSDVYGFILDPDVNEYDSRTKVNYRNSCFLYRMFDRGYVPLSDAIEMGNGAVSYKLSTLPSCFEVYMLASDLEWYGKDEFNKTKFSNDKFRIFLKPHFNLLQIIKMRKDNKKVQVVVPLDE